MTDIPMIDVSGLRSDLMSDRLAVAAQLHQACRNTGFFYATGHGVDHVLMDSVFAAAKRFFALPMAEKQALSLKLSRSNNGYGDLGSEHLDADSPPDINESFNIGLELPADHPQVLAELECRGPNLWPDLPDWREPLLNYFAACLDLGQLIHRGFALDLGLAENFFEDKLNTPMAVLRLLRYPASRASAAPGQWGAGEHTDYGNLTLLATDSVAGLQLKTRSGIWVDAPSIPYAFTCNIGDCLMRWTNDAYVSTPHRVAPPDRERYSIPFFLDPNPDALVSTIEGFGASKYLPILAADYVKARFDATYAHRVDPAL